MFIKKMLTVIVTTSVAVGCALPNTALSEAVAADVAAITDETLDFYDYWKDKYVVQNPYTSETQYYHTRYILYHYVCALSGFRQRIVLSFRRL